jgi:hypothetical protein
MGNTSTRDQWAGRERLHFIERLAWWRGVVNRGDLKKVFGISSAQASADLQGYQELNPGAITYNIRSKRYESNSWMCCVLHEPQMEEALRMFLGESGPLPPVAFEQDVASDSRVDWLRLPGRRASGQVERRIFLAVTRGLSIKIKYWSIAGSRSSRREIAPHAFGNDGRRWHVRAWCFENQGYRDFVLSRIEDADWPDAKFEDAPPDEEWLREETLVLVPHSELDEQQRKTIERDYGMRGGKLTVKVRAAMRGYLLSTLCIPIDLQGNVQALKHLELAEIASP